MPVDDHWLQAARRNPSLVSYQLHIHLTRSQNIEVGRLGRFRFPAGYYVYTGSARKNLIARVQRHLSRDKKLRWHIDYLLACPAAQVREVRLFEQAECAINQRVQGEIPVPGFGASDCRAHCHSHLKYLGPA